MRRPFRVLLAVVVAIIGWAMFTFSVGGGMMMIGRFGWMFGESPGVAIVAVLLMLVGIVAGPLGFYVADRLCPPGDDTSVCPRCQYDLRGQRSAGCPECGWRRSSA